MFKNILLPIFSVWILHPPMNVHWSTPKNTNVHQSDIVNNNSNSLAKTFNTTVNFFQSFNQDNPFILSNTSTINTWNDVLDQVTMSLLDLLGAKRFNYIDELNISNPTHKIGDWAYTNGQNWQNISLKMGNFSSGLIKIYCNNIQTWTKQNEPTNQIITKVTNFLISSSENKRLNAGRFNPFTKLKWTLPMIKNLVRNAFPITEFSAINAWEIENPQQILKDHMQLKQLIIKIRFQVDNQWSSWINLKLVNYKFKSDQEVLITMMRYLNQYSKPISNYEQYYDATGMTKNNTIEDLCQRIAWDLKKIFIDELEGKEFTITHINQKKSLATCAQGEYPHTLYLPTLTITVNNKKYTEYDNFYVKNIQNDTPEIMFKNTKYFFNKYNQKNAFDLQNVNSNLTWKIILPLFTKELEMFMGKNNAQRITYMKFFSQDSTITEKSEIDNTIWKLFYFRIDNNKNYESDWFKIYFKNLHSCSTEYGLYHQIKNYFQSFDKNNPFDLEGYDGQQSWQDVFKLIQSELIRKFGLYNFYQIKNLSLSNPNDQLSKFISKKDDVDYKGINFEVGIFKSSRINIYFTNIEV